MRVPERGLGPAQVAAVIAAAFGLVAVAALASRAHLFGESPPPLPVAASRVVLDGLFYLVLVLEAAVLAFMVWVLWPDDSTPAKVQKRSLWQTLVTPLAIIALIGLVLLLRDRLTRGARLQNLPAAQGGARGGDANPLGSAAALNSHSGFDWIAFGAVCVIVAAAGAWLIYRRQLRRRREIREHRRLAAELEEVMSEGLEELALDPDPRRAVIACYARMERVLAAQGRPRRASEAPFEYLRGLLREVALSPELPGRLTDLYQRAMFSPHEIDSVMRADAVDTLEAIRAQLRELASGTSDTREPLTGHV